ncbi:MAG: hypothetical protein AAF990_00125 [Bacteroidota bacterium]
MSQEIHIACPKCQWQPDPSDEWPCSCGHRWNTFDTGGQCPKCKKIWKYTQCVHPSLGGCSEWSLHIDWYQNLQTILVEELEEIQIYKPIES